MKKEELVPFRLNTAEYKTTLTAKFKARKKWERPDSKQILSIIPGTILEINVKPGQSVNEGETLLILEAMKMANRILMPFDGKIKSILVSKGEIVTKSQLMIEIK